MPSNDMQEDPLNFPGSLMKVFLWLDEKILTIEEAQNNKNYWNILIPMQRNAKKSKIVTGIAFMKKLTVWTKYAATKKKYFFKNKNMKIIAKTYENKK